MRIKNIEMVNVSDLKENPKNTNKHPEEQIERLAKVISYQGFRSPITVSNLSGLIVAGHARLKAAKKLGMTTVPVSYQDFDDEAQEFARLNADNSLALWANIDMKAVRDFDLPDGFDVDLLGFSLFEEIKPVEEELPDLSSSDPDCRQVTFVLSNEQHDIMEEAMTKAKEYLDCSDGINQNSNGNTLAAILREYANS